MADENKERNMPLSGGNDMGQSTTGTLSGGSMGTSSTATAGGTGFGSTSGQRTGASAQTGPGMTSTARQYAGDMASMAKEKSRSLFEQQKENALGQVGSVAHAIRNTASNLQGEGQDQTAHYVQMIADQLESFGGRLRNKDLDTLLSDAQDLARRSPATFIIGSVAAGFLLARFLKSSAQPQAMRRDWEDEGDIIAAGEAAPYVGTARPATSTVGVGADGTPGSSKTATGGTSTPSTGGSTL